MTSADLHPDLRSVRETYDLVAADYADLLRDNLAGKPADRAMLALFADLVRAGADEGAEAGSAPVATLDAVRAGSLRTWPASGWMSSASTCRRA